MTEPMTDERLAEHRAMRDQTRGWGPEEVDTVWDFHAEAVDEIDRLRAENERLRNPRGGHDRECLSGACHCDLGVQK